MAFTDFLFNGSPPASVNTYGSTTSSMPAWYNDFTQGLISKANAIAAAPYQQYTGARNAAVQAPQHDAWANVNRLANAYQPGFDAQGNIISGAQAPAASLASSVANTNTLANSPLANQAFQQALSPGAGANYAQAQNLVANAAQTPAWAGANPYIAQSQALTNPVFDNVSRMATEKLANQENAVADRFIGSGGFQGSRMGSALGAARRGALADLAGQKASLAQNAYNQAISAAQADAARQLQGGTSLAGIGAQQQQILGSLGAQLGQLSSADLTRRLQASQQLGTLANQGLAGGLTSAQAQEASGLAQQREAQRALDTMHADWSQQITHPYSQISFLNNVIRGLQIPVSTQTTNTGPASIYQPSPLSQLTSAGLNLAALSKI